MGKKGPLWWRESDWLLRGSSAANQILLRHSGPILSRPFLFAIKVRGKKCPCISVTKQGIFALVFYNSEDTTENIFTKDLGLHFLSLLELTELLVLSVTATHPYSGGSRISQRGLGQPIISQFFSQQPLWIRQYTLQTHIASPPPPTHTQTLHTHTQTHSPQPHPHHWQI